jgi:hypothetical protein
MYNVGNYNHLVAAHDGLKSSCMQLKVGFYLHFAYLL